jgi:hypothetical protein
MDRACEATHVTRLTHHNLRDFFATSATGHSLRSIPNLLKLLDAAFDELCKV